MSSSEDAYLAAESSRRLDLVVLDGVVHSFTLDPPRVRVAIEDGLVTDDLPFFGPSGGRFRGWSPPVVGEPVVVLCPTGEPTQGRVIFGLDSDGFAHPGWLQELAVLLWDSEDEELLDSYDAATQTRTLRVPAGGQIRLLVEGGAEILLQGDTATLKADILLLGPDGARKAVARHGDPVVSGAIVASSTKVKSA